MSIRILSMIIFFSIVGLINDIINVSIQKYKSKKSNYDCSKCKVYNCPYKTCKKYK